MGKHRRMSSTSKKFAALGAAAITTTALTVAVVPDPNADKSRDELLRLLADIRPFGTDPQAIPDLTGGLGSSGYDLAQQLADQLARLLVENVNLQALAQAAGFDPQSLVDDLLGGVLNDVVGGALTGVLGSTPIVPISATGLTSLLTQVLTEVLGNAVLAGTIGGLLGVPVAGDLNDNLFPGTLRGIFTQMGFNLPDPIIPADDEIIPGYNIVTTGPLFTVLKMLGGDVGWVPALPNSVADDINETSYLRVGLGQFVTISLLQQITDLLGGVAVPDAEAIRVIPVIGVGLGAFAAGAAYQQVVDDLENQPGGSNSDDQPLLGSYTLLPMVLLLNPGRANGGPLARAYPLFRLIGIDTVTPETHIESDGDGLPVNLPPISIPGVGTIPGGPTGLEVGSANLIPIKLDIGIQNHPLSDFAAWPNPVTLANNAAALLFPTYIIRGADLTNITGSLAGQLAGQLPGVLASRPLGLNFYLTIPVDGAPVLEPTYLFVDAINLLTGANLNNPIGTALNPFLTSAGNLGYTDTVRNADGEYVRTFDDTGVPTAFFSFPDVDWTKVPGDLTNSLVEGIQQAIADGPINTGPPAVNALKVLLGLLGLDNLSTLGGSGFDLSSISELAEGLVGNALGSTLQSEGVQAESLKTTGFAPTDPASTSTGSGQTVKLSKGSPSGTQTPTVESTKETTTPKKRPVLDLIESLGNSVTSPTKTTAGTTVGTNGAAQVQDAVKKASDQVKKTLNDVNEGVTKAVSDVKKAVDDTAKKVNDAAKKATANAE